MFNLSDTHHMHSSQYFIVTAKDLGGSANVTGRDLKETLTSLTGM